MTCEGCLCIGDVGAAACDLPGRYGLELVEIPDAAPIPASFWGEPEAGIAGMRIYARLDTPVHSLLHEAAHIVCMTQVRRAALEGNAGGDDLEEAAVCYLQVVLADYVRGAGRARLMCDMDAWGYSFRLGNTRAWFENDSSDARRFLATHGIVDASGAPTWNLRR